MTIKYDPDSGELSDGEKVVVVDATDPYNIRTVENCVKLGYDMLYEESRTSYKLLHTSYGGRYDVLVYTLPDSERQI
jgi:hypothetical protein